MSLHRLICNCCKAFTAGVGLDLTLPTYINCLIEFTDEAGAHSFDLILKKSSSASKPCSYETYIGDLALCDEYPHAHYAITRPGFSAGNASSHREVCSSIPNVGPCDQGTNGMEGSCTNAVSTFVKVNVTRDSGFRCRCWIATVIITNLIDTECFSACTVQTISCSIGNPTQTGITARGITSYTSKMIVKTVSDYVDGNSSLNIGKARTNTGGTATYCPSPDPCLAFTDYRGETLSKQFVCNATNDGLFSVYSLPATTPYCTTRSAVSGGNSTTYAARNIRRKEDFCNTFPTISLPGQTVAITNLEVYA